MSLLSGTGIAVRRGGVSVLAGVNFRLEEGEMVGLIGPNGAGKTTLLRALCGLQRREAGQIAILGDDLERLPRDHLARLLAYLPQGGGSQWGVAVETLVTLGRLPHRGPWRGPSPADAAAVESAMRACDVLQFAERSVSQLSGGELARVLLARALAGEPAILLADEPVAGLDPGHQIDVMAILRERTAARAGVAVVMHDLTLAARHCDRLVLLDRGGVAAEGPPALVLSPETLAAHFGVRAFSGKAEGGPVVVPVARTTAPGWNNPGGHNDGA